MPNIIMKTTGSDRLAAALDLSGKPAEAVEAEIAKFFEGLYSDLRAVLVDKLNLPEDYFEAETRDFGVFSHNKPPLEIVIEAKYRPAWGDEDKQRSIAVQLGAAAKSYCYKLGLNWVVAISIQLHEGYYLRVE